MVFAHREQSRKGALGPWHKRVVGDKLQLITVRHTLFVDCVGAHIMRLAFLQTREIALERALSDIDLHV